MDPHTNSSLMERSSYIGVGCDSDDYGGTGAIELPYLDYWSAFHGFEDNCNGQTQSLYIFTNNVVAFYCKSNLDLPHVNDAVLAMTPNPGLKRNVFLSPRVTMESATPTSTT